VEQSAPRREHVHWIDHADDLEGSAHDLQDDGNDQYADYSTRSAVLTSGP
jgi:hypothetical protein